MATLKDRPFSKDYSGLINQSVIAGCLIVLCLCGSEIMKRRRRGPHRVTGLGSVESWEFGYLYQARSWSKNPSPAIPLRWPLQWIKQAFSIPERKLLKLRGLDATTYSRFLRGCTWFTFIQSFTTVPILLPIHVHFAGSEVPLGSMTRASISALVETPTGIHLLWIHLVLLFWITFSWIAVLIWICSGVFRYRKILIDRSARRIANEDQQEQYSQYHPHPNPQYLFSTLPSLDNDKSNRGIRLRTVMVTNIPPSLRSEKDLAEYFQYYLKKAPTRSVPLTKSLGLMGRISATIFRQAKEHIHLSTHPDGHHSRDNSLAGEESAQVELKSDDAPEIDRVVVVRKMTELASFLERREVVLRKLETAHIALARRVLGAVHAEILRREGRRTLTQRFSLAISSGKPGIEDSLGVESDMDILVRELRPFAEQLNALDEVHKFSPNLRSSRQRKQKKEAMSDGGKTVWDVLFSLPRSTLDSYQPLVQLSTLFRNKAVPAIDYYAAKLGLLTSLIAESRAQQATSYDAVSTAFVTFKDPKDAMRACQVLPAHPTNLLSCKVTMAPCYEDLDWVRLMKSTYKGEFLKDWVVSLGVWAFTLFWLFPLSLFVGLISIQNISAYLPSLSNYLNSHPWEEDLIQSFVPTVIVSLLTLLIPVLLILIAKKAHTLFTLSALHDRVMTRYYKFLIVNILVFFCVGTAAVQSVLLSFSSADTTKDILNIVASSFPSAGPFYVGWMIFTTGMHSALEVALVGLPLLTYLFTRRAKTPRRRSVGTRPRTFNYFYWLPNHMLIFQVVAVFSVLNPLVIPFAFVYFLVDSTVIKNQFVHVYAKVYESNGRTLLIRIVRYSLDGLVLLQVVFVAYMAVLKVKVNVALSATLIFITVLVKLGMTRVLRTSFQRLDLLEAQVLCGNKESDGESIEQDIASILAEEQFQELPTSSRLWRTWKNFSFNYTKYPARVRRTNRRQANPFSRSNSPLAMQCDEQPTSAELSPGTVFKVTEHIRSPGPSDAPTECIAERPRSTSPLNRPQSTALERKQSYARRPPAEEAPTRLPAPLPLVSQHPRVAKWDDEPDPNRPFDNPYYSAPIGSSLWLPRNPYGILDLDETVDVRKALTTVESAGELGQWQTLSAMPSPQERPPLTASPEHEDAPSPTSMRARLQSQGMSSSLPHSVVRQLSGTETISLPPRIEARVNDPDAFDPELKGEAPHRPIFGQRRRSSRSTIGASSFMTAQSLSLRRPLTTDAEHGVEQSNVRSHAMLSTFSLGAAAHSIRHGKNASQLGLGGRVGTSTQALSAGLELDEAQATQNPDTVVSAQEAVQAEVVVEEQEEMDARRLEEAEEISRSMRRRAWWQRWAFTSPSE